MSACPGILCVGHDQLLNRTRQRILEKQFRVKCVLSVAEAASLLSAEHFDLVVLCYSLTDEECRAIAESVHHLPTQPGILALGPAPGGILLHPRDEELLSGGPAELLRKAASMTGLAGNKDGSKPANPVPRKSTAPSC